MAAGSARVKGRAVDKRLAARFVERVTTADPALAASPYVIRLAREEDTAALTALIAASARGLQRGDYDAGQIEGALGTLFGVDRQLIADGTYYVVETAGELAGCGGWSRRRTLYGADAGPGRDDSALDPTIDAARIRAFFVHPGHARRGVGERILSASERAAADAGFTRMELGATLTGVPFYARHGYQPAETTAAPLPDGGALAIVRMTKAL